MGVLLLLLALSLPIHTPGVVNPHANVCGTKWGLDHRKVTEAMKREVARRYGLHRDQIKGSGRCCEIDHLIPRELGGADDVDNLWPQPWADAHAKDKRENQLHRDVCAGTVTLKDAQEQMRMWGKP